MQHEFSKKPQICKSVALLQQFTVCLRQILVTPTFIDNFTPRYSVGLLTTTRRKTLGLTKKTTFAASRRTHARQKYSMIGNTAVPALAQPGDNMQNPPKAEWCIHWLAD